MNPLRIAWGDLAKSQILTDSTEAVGYPGSNAVHPHLSRAWRTTSPSAQWLKLDAGVGKKINFDSALIIGHNLTSAAVVKVQTDDADTWAPPGGMDKNGDPTQPIIFMDLAPSPTAWRYARIYIDDAANPAGYLQIGRVMLCMRYEGLEQIDTGFSVGYDDTTIVTRSLTGQVFSDIGVASLVYSMSMGSMRDETKVSLLALCKIVGQWDPVVVIPSDGIDPLYATMNKGVKFSQVTGWIWSDDGLSFVEAH